ncbi:CDP-glycerol glycerophosphotransferase family protein [Brevibacterium sp. 50QC2O2]|uniref:bifunctional glycosyltransferase/CDP-glycerol:glycerophosphate glycerophosphotransferase n=1 Tax=Brevibacterium TaxID=1696 RepID=UPI00211C3C82|nr:MULTISPECIES: CDP-glycerol glycerophosphotransferase family protein [unclassified Brevibacterium]MCQ9386010.1 CDP-glycerol glycerophosphotransferase family protein [Brevibacterium sp. 68QC2CO]MCQ9387699.1 CDP-glycerol glycerophosphotransferase family protein [Brevibacterium sp. 50QC2O2]
MHHDQIRTKESELPMSVSASARSLPTFAVVSAVYNVDRFLGDFTGSLDRQTIDHARLHVIMVDDGSTDDSAQTLRTWAQRTDIDVTVVSQTNAGQGPARNHGLELVGNADWVTFIDPDDFVADDYFERISDFLIEHPDAIMAVGHQHDYYDDGREEQVDRHPLRFRFAGGDQLVDIDRFPRFIHMHAASTFFRVTTLHRLNTHFDKRIRPIFEDGHFVAHYLLDQRDRLVGFVGTAIYNYRRRADGTSSLQIAGVDPRKYTDVLEFGYLDLLTSASRLSPTIPRWIQNTVIYELTWVLRAEESMFGKTAGLDQTTCIKFHQLVSKIRPFLEDIVVEGFDLIKRSASQREALSHGYDSVTWHWDRVFVSDLDHSQGLVKLTYRFTGPQPEEEFLVRGLTTQPHHSKTRDIVYLQRTLLHERTVWVWSNGEIEARISGKSIPLTFTWPTSGYLTLRRGEIEKYRAKSSLPTRKTPSRKTFKFFDGDAERLANLRIFKNLFSRAWVLMDRGPDAHDNAEHLFTYLRKHRRDINAWFVVSKDSPDYSRLKKAGYKRVIAHGSLLWKILCLNATHIVSSHANGHVYNPFPRTGGWKWKFFFLQHGVIKDDLSRWLSPKPIAGFITTTQAEYASVCGEGSEYKFSPHEVANTGLARYDRLVRIAARHNDPKSIVVMPTWRQFLVGDVDPATGAPGLLADFEQSEYCQAWTTVVNSTTLQSLARAFGLSITFMPHPNITPYLDRFNIPQDVHMASYETDDVQEVLANAALVITDYSSIAFDTAMIRRPVVYYQFDREVVFRGGHTTRPGYFDYDRDGFGPVCRTFTELEESLPALLDSPGELRPEFAERVEQVFAPADGKNCERTVAFIESLGKKLTRRQARTPIPTPPAPKRYPEAVNRTGTLTPVPLTTMTQASAEAAS